MLCVDICMCFCLYMYDHPDVDRLGYLPDVRDEFQNLQI